MSLRTRRFLYILFIFAFFTITPTLILYSLGYNLQSGFKLQKSGILIIETDPKGATIDLGKKHVQGFWTNVFNSNEEYVQTPAKIKNLSPGEYEIALKLDGYFTWTKKLTVLPGQTTFATNIYLFKNDQANQILESPAINSSFSLNEKYFATISSSSAKLLILDNEKLESYNFPTSSSANYYQSSEINWSKDRKKLISSSTLFFVDDWKNPKDLNKIIGAGFPNYIWENDNNILFFRENKLFSFNINTNNKEEILNLKNINQFIAKNNSIFFIEQTDNKSALLSWDKSKNNPIKILELPFSKYLFSNNGNSLLNLYDANNKILYLIDTNSDIKSLKKTIYNCDLVKWITDSRLLFSTGNEIWLADLNSNTDTLLTRISERITDIEWHPSNGYILYSTETSVFILELDNREKNSITKIADFKGINDIILDEKGEILYILDRDINSEKLYKLFIQ